jgi:hypothetical protein
VELLDAKRFAAWVLAEFGKDSEQLEIPEPLLKVIGEYAADGYRWFLFDVVDLKKAAAKKTPLKIQFKTDHLYYPMRITRTEKGPTTVALSILSNVLFNESDCIGIPRKDIHIPAKPRQIPGDTVKWIDTPIYELLGRPANVHLRSWEITGQIDSFEKDLLVRNPATPTKPPATPTLPAKPDSPNVKPPKAN